VKCELGVRTSASPSGSELLKSLLLLAPCGASNLSHQQAPWEASLDKHGDVDGGGDAGDDSHRDDVGHDDFDDDVVYDYL
jgi:hypothetical protein